MVAPFFVENNLKKFSISFQKELSLLSKPKEMDTNQLVKKELYMVDSEAEATITETKDYIVVSFDKEYRRDFYDYILLLWRRLNSASLNPIAKTSWVGRIQEIRVPL